MKFPKIRLLPAKKQQYARTFTRHSCQMDATLMLIDRMFSFEGRIIDISRGGAMFRPKLAYIMYRRDVPICMTVGTEELFGSIVNTGSAGFSVRFDEPLDEEDIVDILDRFNPQAKAAA